MRLSKKFVGAFRSNEIVYSAIRTRDWLKYRYFRQKGAATGRSFAEGLGKADESSFCFVVSFNTPWVIDALTKGWQKYSNGMILVVVDNSTSPAARQSIEKICKIRGVPYFGLPGNPERKGGRSHGISMNWIYYNIVRHLKPKAFGFLDHDCLPIAPLDFAERLGRKTGYGLRLVSASNYKFKKAADDKGWFLWAGLCFFRYRDVEHLPLDFRGRGQIGLDTGGGNWNPIYSRLPSEDFEFATESSLPLHLGEVDAKYQILDKALLHVGGASYKGPSSEIDYRRLFSDHVWTTYLDGTQNRIVMI
ncbi:hypothetical protein [Mesorhizobium neociceri]|uniref:Glycosyltransferase n=1 Tax=Mesorhizobium neociceri TaxID=1307853 RepID=A0A838BBR6_9HYPH|nr:hypothetical protein [Mesorhizobium neociceri]MBA1143692.1 hypothetical protein [Mesorhizobium neociceri]